MTKTNTLRTPDDQSIESIFEKKALQAAETVHHEKNCLQQILDVLDNDTLTQLSAKNNPKANELLDQIKQSIPESDEDLLAYLNDAQLEKQPTEILMLLAERLKDRREKLYPEEQMQNLESENDAESAHSTEPN